MLWCGCQCKTVGEVKRIEPLDRCYDLIATNKWKDNAQKSSKLCLATSPQRIANNLRLPHIRIHKSLHGRNKYNIHGQENEFSMYKYTFIRGFVYGD